MNADPHRARDARRQQILAAAARVFAAQGYAATRVHDVAEHAGVAYGLVYHYFGSKPALLQTVFDEAWTAFADAVEGIAASARPPADRVRAVLDYVFGAWQHRPELLQVVVHEYGRHARLGDPAEHPQVRRALCQFERIYAAGRLAPGADASALTALLMGALEAAVTAGPVADGPSPALRSTLLLLFRDAPFRPDDGESEVVCTST